jgi:hypothetical protein
MPSWIGADVTGMIVPALTATTEDSSAITVGTINVLMRIEIAAI